MRSDTHATEAARGDLFLKQLRTATAANHEALEAHPFSRAITSPTVPREDYIRYLSVMQRVTAGMEAVLFPALRSLVPDLELRGKQALLATDLGYLGSPGNPFPPFVPFDHRPSAAFALGAFYVLEGSTLGGRVILKNLNPGLALSPDQGTRYFEGYGAATGEYWQRLQLLLCDTADDGHSAAEMIDGAQSAFLHILDYFNLCQAYEAEGHRQP